MNRSEWKAAARRALGNGIFKESWLMALVFCLVITVISGAAGNLVPCLGALLVLGPLSYAQARVFLNLTREGKTVDLNGLFCGFKDDFGGTFLLGLLASLFCMLWSLLFVIPGVVKFCAYSQCYYLKADHPEYDWRTCLRESENLMRGHKWEYFVLQLSFIGWFIVGSLCLGVGTLWVVPYLAATNAQYHEYLKSPKAGSYSPEF